MRSSDDSRLELPAAQLVLFDGFEQRLEVAFAEALVALALNDLEEDGTDYGVGEDLEQQALALGGRAVDQDRVLAQPRCILAVRTHPLFDLFVVGVRRFEKPGAAFSEGFDSGVDIIAGQSDVLDALAPADGW